VGYKFPGLLCLSSNLYRIPGLLDQKLDYHLDLWLLNISFHAADDFKLFRESMEYKDVRILYLHLFIFEFPVWIRIP